MDPNEKPSEELSDGSSVSPEESSTEAPPSTNPPSEKSSEPNASESTSASNPSSVPDATGDDGAVLPDDAPEELKTLEAEAVAKNNAAEDALMEAGKATDAFEEAVDDHLVNDDEVGVVEGAGVDSDIVAMIDVDVTCFKCGQKSGTSVTKKQYDDQAEAGEQPKFKTRCNKCNYHSTYVLGDEGAHTIA